ncbi:photosynthetic reaction center subunit H [Sphingosinicellaceae bacterium]|nr:photosynthetic reaction center subunit H [Sphingosinicellaceae bacterium]
MHFTAGLDIAELVLWAFFLFFLGLIIYLRREDRREGYPLEDDVTGRINSPGGILEMAKPKTFVLPFDLGTVTQPNGDRDSMNLRARRTGPWAGSPLVPTGNPLTAGVGPGSYALRADRPDLNMEGHPRIVPMVGHPDFYVSRRDPDPRGFAVVGADRVVAGTVVDAWIDTADRVVRYLEVALPGGGSVLAPMFMATVERKRRIIEVDALLGHQFAGAPPAPVDGTITLLQEELAQAYFGAGYLYATAARQEPIL